METGLRRHLARGTEEQKAQPCNSTSSPDSWSSYLQNANTDASPIALSREAIGGSFERATTGVGASRGSSHKGSFFSVSSRPGAVCQSRREYTLHWLEHLEVCSSLIII